MKGCQMLKRTFTSGWMYFLIACIAAFWILIAEAFNVWNEKIFWFLSPSSIKIANWGMFFVSRRSQ
jgi:hypothetical protein